MDDHKIQESTLQIGQRIKFVDEIRRLHDALITTVWNDKMINLLYISSNPAEHDSYGRQSVHKTSVPKRQDFNQHAGYFFFNEEEVPADMVETQVTREYESPQKV